MLEAFHRLPTASLRAIAPSLREGMLAAGLTRSAIQQVAGGSAADVEAALGDLVSLGMTPTHAAVVIDAIVQTRDAQPDPARLLDLVLSGPDVPGVPTADTAAVMHTLISQAEREVVLVGYAIHKGKRLFESLATRMQDLGRLRVTFCVDIGRPFGDTSLASEIVRRFAIEFRTKHWPWPPLPEVYYDPRALSESTDERASLHAKCVIVDGQAALVTSANFTEAAQRRNVEVGLLIRHAPLVARLNDYFAALRATGLLSRCALE